MLVFMKLLNCSYQARSFLPAEVFLLQTNFTNAFLFSSHLLLLLDAVRAVSLAGQFPAFSHPELNSKTHFHALHPCDLVHSHRSSNHLHGKTLRHWEWLVTTLGWLYALAMDVAIIVYKINTSTTTFHILPSSCSSAPPCYGLHSFSSPGNNRQCQEKSLPALSVHPGYGAPVLHTPSLLFHIVL